MRLLKIGAVFKAAFSYGTKGAGKVHEGQMKVYVEIIKRFD